ncbi:hypothetical protein JCM30237_25240 [Halolamina litorea]|uniref:ArsR family transcriptional regulator n=1 Tax=Halolamina litorea TaxID=1515593 RepID=A0ABD6BV91_9EURY|nr:hypothetical protein [Halolamina litorea]
MESEPRTETDIRLDAVSHAARRRVLYTLLAARWNGSSGVSIGSIYPERGENQVVELYHLHLPKLESGGFVGVDREQDRVEVGPRFDEIVPLLDHLAEDAATEYGTVGCRER